MGLPFRDWRRDGARPGFRPIRSPRRRPATKMGGRGQARVRRSQHDNLTEPLQLKRAHRRRHGVSMAKALAKQRVVGNEVFTGDRSAEYLPIKVKAGVATSFREVGE